MATHPDDPNATHSGEAPKTPRPTRREGETGETGSHPAAKPESPKKTKMARQAGKPTMMAHGEDEAAVPAMPNLSLDKHEEDIPVLSEADVEEEVAEAQPVSDVAEAQPVSDVATAKPVSDVTGADLRRMDTTGAEHVLGDDVEEAPASAIIDSGVLQKSDVPVIAEEASDVAEAEAVLDDEPLDRGSRASARADSPIRAEATEVVDMDDALDLGGPPPSGGKKSKRADLEATEPVFAGTSGTGTKRKDADLEETAAFAMMEDEYDESSAVDLGKSPGPSKGPSGIDEVAEALESGVDLADQASPPPAKGPPSVEFDDILGEETAVVPKKKTAAPVRTKKAIVDEEEAAAAVFAEDDDEAAAVPVDDEATEAMPAPADAEDEAVAAAVDDEADAVAAAVDEEEPAPKKKAKREPEPAAKKTVAPAASGPGCLGRMIGAMFFLIVGIVLAAGAVAGMAYVQPDLIEQVPESPWVVKKPAPPPRAEVKLTAAQQAYDRMAADDLDGALELVKDETDDAAKAVRGEARIQKALKGKDLTKPLDKAEIEEINKGLQDLREGKKDALANQIEGGLRYPALFAAYNQAQKDLENAQKGLKSSDGDRKQAEALVKEIGAALAGAKIIENADVVKADDVKKALKNLSDAQASLAAVNKALKDADVKDSGARGVAELLAAKKDSEGKLNEVNKALADGNVKTPGAKGIQEVLDARAKVQKDRDELDAAIKAAYAEMVKAKVVPEGSDPRKAIAAGAKAAREKGESPLAGPLTQLGSALAGAGSGIGKLVQKGFDNSVLAGEVGFFRVREQFIQTPEQKLDLYVDLLKDRKLKDAKKLDAIVRETDWLLSKDAKASAETRAKALYVSGLAHRNQEKFDPARKALDEAAKAADAKSAWSKQAKLAHAELSDPTAYYIPQIDKLRSAGNVKGALAESNAGLKALPNNGKLLAERGLIRLEIARTSKMTGAAEKQIRADADAAIKSGGTADGSYVLGLLEEDLGQFAKAEALYREAIKSHKGTDDAASRYRIALARVLLRDRPVIAVPPAPPAEKEKEKAKTSSLPTTPAQQPTAYMHPLTALVLSASIGAQPLDEPEPETENPEVAKRVRESVALAKTLAMSKDTKVREQGYALLAQAVGKAGTQLKSTTCLELAKDLLSVNDPKVKGTGHMLHGQGLAKQGRRTEGLKEFGLGMEMLNPGLESKEVVRMLDEHPAFQHPDAANRPNPLLAEKHFGQGLHYYWTKKYADAEVQFKIAMDYFGQDARYCYYLGLAQLHQKTKLKRDQAYYSFEKGAQLEAQSRPSVAEINTSLERVQGDLRQFLNQFRNRPVVAATQ